MSYLKELALNIAASIYMTPCTEEKLFERDFLKTTSIYGIQRMIMQLEKNAIYYKGDTMHIRKSWARKNLQEYELDLRTKREKNLDSLSDFQKTYYEYF